MGYGVYFFFAALSFLAFFFAFFLVPETKGIPLEKMDRLFEIRPVWRAHETLSAQLADEDVQLRADDKSATVHRETGSDSDAARV